jgi:3-oxoacyl-[acyl-carrier protein] reductase
VRRGGAVINLASSVGVSARSDYGAYAAGKASVNALTIFMMGDLRERNVTVNAIASDSLRADPANPDRPRELADIAEAIAYLAGPGRWVNGQILYAGR